MPEQPAILAVDDDDNALFALEGVLTQAGYRVMTACNGREALQRMEAAPPDLLLLDLVMPEMDGYEVTKAVKSDALLKYIPVVLMSSKDDCEDIVRGLDFGADDYIKKPFRKEELLARVNAAMRTRGLYRDLQRTQDANRKLRLELDNQNCFSEIIGKSASVREIFALIEKIKESDVPVLVTGESGTGKELVAKAIHRRSPRAQKAFLVQNCSAFNENLLESELFGHVRGAFTGAVRDKQGLFEAADGGTFFLDELGEMSPALQVKLLRVLQDGTFLPVGGTKVKKVDVRVIAATNRELREMVRQGTFREDLYYRLNVVNIVLPPLRQRRVDIPLLAEHFLAQFAARSAASAKTLNHAALRLLADYDWPGNVRELQNELERAVLLSGRAAEIGAEDLSPHIRDQGAAVGGRGRRLDGKLKDAVENLERNMILAALERLDWNKSEAARELGISRSSLITKIAVFGLEKA